MYSVKFTQVTMLLNIRLCFFIQIVHIWFCRSLIVLVFLYVVFTGPSVFKCYEFISRNDITIPYVIVHVPQKKVEQIDTTRLCIIVSNSGLWSCLKSNVFCSLSKHTFLKRSIGVIIPTRLIKINLPTTMNSHKCLRKYLLFSVWT